MNSMRTAYTAPGDSEILDLDDTLYLGGLPEDRAGLIFPTEVCVCPHVQVSIQRFIATDCSSCCMCITQHNSDRVKLMCQIVVNIQRITPVTIQVWTALLNYGYVGCIRDLFVDGQSKDIRRLAEAQRAVGVKPSCSREPPKQCLSNPCQHNGICREGWNRYVCDCSGTGYLGRSCERGG